MIGWFFSTRFFVVLLLALALVCYALTRVNLSIGIVCMVNSDSNNKSGQQCKSSNNSTCENSTNFAALNNDSHVTSTGSGNQIRWTSAEQGTVFSAYFWGAIIGAIPAGWLSDRYGPKLLILSSMLVNIGLTLLTPVAAVSGLGYMIALRSVIGVAQGVYTPCISSTVARWIPPNERSSAISIYTLGNQLGVVIAMPLFALLCSWQGWPSIFYVSGALCLVWCFLWVIFGSNGPSQNRFLTEKEKAYISNSLVSEQTADSEDVKVPWMEVLFSGPVLACNIVMFTGSFWVNMLQSYLPTYFKQVLRLDIQSNGFYSSAPFASQIVFKLIFAFVADLVKQKTSLSRTTICKAFNTFAFVGGAASIVAVSFIDSSNPIWIVILLCAAQAFSGALVPGAYTAIVALAPPYAGTLRSFASIWSGLAGVCGPLIVGAIVSTQTARADWQKVFFTVASCQIVAAVAFLVLGSAEVQHWAKRTYNAEATPRTWLMLCRRRVGTTPANVPSETQQLDGERKH